MKRNREELIFKNLLADFFNSNKKFKLNTTFYNF